MPHPNFPCYCVFGNGVDEWCLDIVVGNGIVQNVITIKSEQIKKIYESKLTEYEEPKTYSKQYWYIKAKQEIMRQLEQKEKTCPLV